MNLQENIQRIREMMGVNEQLSPTTGMTDDISTEETNVEPENIDARGNKLGEGIKKLFNKLKKGIFKGVENVQEFLKKIKGNKKTDLIPTDVEYGQVQLPIESKTNDGYSPLFIACQEGHLEVVKFLANEKEANIESKANDGANSFIIA